MRCPACEAEIEEKSSKCPQCGEAVARPRRPAQPSQGDEVVATVIPYKNVKALLAYYLGVFGLIPVVGLFLGPAALVLGILGLRHVRRNPQAHGTGHAITGIVLGSLELLGHVAVIVLIILAVAFSK